MRGLLYETVYQSYVVVQHSHAKFNLGFVPDDVFLVRRIEFLDRFDLLVDVGELVEPVRALPEDRLDVGDLAVVFVVARPAADLLALHLRVVEHAVRPAVGLDRGVPDVRVLVVRVGDGFRVPALADAFGRAAENADVAGHRLQGRRHAAVLLPVGVAARRPRRLQCGGLRVREHVGEFSDVGGRHAANTLRPFRRLRHAVRLAEDVVLEALFALGPAGHGAGIHALAKRVDELLVLQVVREDVMRHAGHHRRVGIRPDGNPPGVVGGAGIRELRIDHHELAATLLRHAHVVERVAAVEGVGGIPAPHDDELAVGKRIVLVAVVKRAEGPLRARCRALVTRHRPRVGAAAEHAEEARQQAVDLIRLVQHAERTTGVGLVENRRRAVRLLDVDHLLCDVVERLVPAHALELAFAAFADTQHRIEQAFGRIDARAIGAAAQTGAQLRHLLALETESAVGLVAAVVA